ncbi:MAG: leucine-rich repeat domain-containing protein [Clostridia bacterium]|nr:leucine-rich repeat domain-containing protein [Clostridia bacterium]
MKKIVKFLPIIFAIALSAFAVSACKEEPPANPPAPVSQNLEFRQTEGGYLVSGLGECTDSEVWLPTEHEGQPVIGIAASAFYDEDGIEKLHLSSSIKTIGAFAFESCNHITEISVNEENPHLKTVDGDIYSKDGKTFVLGAFWKGEALAEIESGVEKISPAAFYGCGLIEEVSLPKGLKEIGAHAFQNCVSLNKINLRSSTVQSIGAQAFKGCINIKTLTLPSGLSSLGEYAFSNCTRLRSVVFGTGLTSVPRGAFEGCTKLETVDLYTKIESIGESAFSSCYFLSSVRFSNVLEEIGAWAFLDCRTLAELDFPQSLKTIGNYAFQGCDYLTSISLPALVETVGNGAFFGCRDLAEVSFSASLQKIGQYAFYGCKNIAEVELPATLNEIGENAFVGCTALSRAKFIEPSGWSANEQSLTLTDEEMSADLLTEEYVSYTWNKA